MCVYYLFVVYYDLLKKVKMRISEYYDTCEYIIDKSGDDFIYLILIRDQSRTYFDIYEFGKDLLIAVYDMEAILGDRICSKCCIGFKNHFLFFIDEASWTKKTMKEQMLFVKTSNIDIQCNEQFWDKNLHGISGHPFFHHSLDRIYLV